MVNPPTAQRIINEPPLSLNGVKEYMNVKTHHFKTSSLFTCQACGVDFEELEDSKQQAKRHAQDTGHNVNGEVVTAYHYSPIIPDLSDGRETVGDSRI